MHVHTTTKIVTENAPISTAIPTYCVVFTNRRKKRDSNVMFIQYSIVNEVLSIQVLHLQSLVT